MEGQQQTYQTQGGPDSVMYHHHQAASPRMSHDRPPPSYSDAMEGGTGGGDHPSAFSAMPPDLYPSEPDGPIGTIYRTDSDGCLHFESRPSCVSKCFMCPFPFFCIGCCMSRSSDVTFDDISQTVILHWWKGYCCCSKTKEVLNYKEIANIVLRRETLQINQQPTYSINLLTKDGVYHRLNDPQLVADHRDQVLGLHRFLFGRVRLDYRSPDVFTLLRHD